MPYARSPRGLHPHPANPAAEPIAGPTDAAAEPIAGTAGPTDAALVPYLLAAVFYDLDGLGVRVLSALSPEDRAAVEEAECRARRRVLVPMPDGTTEAWIRPAAAEPLRSDDEIAAREALWAAWVAEHAEDLATTTLPMPTTALERADLWVAGIEGDHAIAAGPTPEAAWAGAVRWELDRLAAKGTEDPWDTPPESVAGWVAEQMAGAGYQLMRLTGADPERLCGLAHVEAVAALRPDVPELPEGVSAVRVLRHLLIDWRDDPAGEALAGRILQLAPAAVVAEQVAACLDYDRQRAAEVPWPADTDPLSEPAAEALRVRMQLARTTPAEVAQAITEGRHWPLRATPTTAEDVVAWIARTAAPTWLQWRAAGVAANEVDAFDTGPWERVRRDEAVARTRLAELQAWAARVAAQIEACRRWLDEGGREAVARALEALPDPEPASEVVTRWIAVAGGDDVDGIGETPREAMLEAQTWTRELLTMPDQLWNYRDEPPDDDLPAELFGETLGNLRFLQVRGPEDVIRALRSR